MSLCKAVEYFRFLRGPKSTCNLLTACVLRCRSQWFSIISVRVDGPRAGTAGIVINWRFTDTGESLVATLEHGALTSITGTTGQNAVTTVLAEFEPGFPI